MGIRFQIAAPLQSRRLLAVNRRETRGPRIFLWMLTGLAAAVCGRMLQASLRAGGDFRGDARNLCCCAVFALGIAFIPRCMTLLQRLRFRRMGIRTIAVYTVEDAFLHFSAGEAMPRRTLPLSRLQSVRDRGAYFRLRFPAGPITLWKSDFTLGDADAFPAFLESRVHPERPQPAPSPHQKKE